MPTRGAQVAAGAFCAVMLACLFVVTLSATANLTLIWFLAIPFVAVTLGFVFWVYPNGTEKQRSDVFAAIGVYVAIFVASAFVYFLYLGDTIAASDCKFAQIGCNDLGYAQKLANADMAEKVLLFAVLGQLPPFLSAFKDIAMAWRDPQPFHQYTAKEKKRRKDLRKANNQTVG